MVGAFTRFGNTLRFPRVTREPPRTSFCGVSLWPLFPQDKESFFEIHRTQKKRFSFSRSLRVFSPLVLHLLPLTVVVRVSYHSTSPGEWRVVTPAGIARVRRPRRVVFSRRLRPCPRKASTWSEPGRREMHALIE